jgi:hypothetical protein
MIELRDGTTSERLDLIDKSEGHNDTLKVTTKCEYPGNHDRVRMT